jgi:signal transduction histidine kinase
MSVNPAQDNTPAPERNPAAPDSADQSRLGHALRLAALREHNLLSFSELSQNLSASPDLHHMADLALFNLMGQFGTSKSALWILSGTDRRTPVLMRAYGISPAIARALGTACASSLVDREESPRGPLSAEGLSGQVDEAARMLVERAGVAVLAPIPAMEGTLGLLALGPRIGGQAYGSVELKSVQAASAVLGVAVQNLGLLTEMAQNNRQLRRANDQLEGLDRLKSQLLSNVTHELRTPLTIIIGYLESLISVDPRENGDRAILQLVLTQAMRLNSIVGNLLTLSQSHQGVLELKMETGDVGLCVRHCLADLRAMISSTLRTLTWSIEPDLPPARFDNERLVQIVEALLDNAIKFTHEGAQVGVRVYRLVRESGVSVAIEVSDDGPGIPPEGLPYVFEPFRQVDGSATRAVGGLGIGLSYSRQLAAAMGGDITVQSDPGHGTTFTVIFPCVQAESGGETEAAA